MTSDVERSKLKRCCNDCTYLKVEGGVRYTHIFCSRVQFDPIVAPIDLIEGKCKHLKPAIMAGKPAVPSLRTSPASFSFTLWTTSRFISSVGAVTLEAVKKYIEGQKGQ
jgi:REP element-mobilizing transposase RayT